MGCLGCRAGSLRADAHLKVLTAGVLHGQPIQGGHVHLHTQVPVEFHLMQQDGQEKDLQDVVSVCRLPKPKIITFSLSTLLARCHAVVRNRSGRTQMDPPIASCNQREATEEAAWGLGTIKRDEPQLKEE